MNIFISDEAVDWYKKELEIDQPTSLRFFVRYGGVGGHIPGFSLGLELEKPRIVHTSTIVNKIKFYIEEDDAWYFDNKDLVITMDKNMEEPQFTYQ